MLMEQRPLVAVHLYGPLAKKFGALHHFDVRNPREAVAALDANYRGVVQAFTQYEHFHIIADGDLRDGDSAAELPVAREIHFLPKVEGNAFLGAMLVGALIPSLAGTLTASILGGLLFAGVMVGLSMLLRPDQRANDEASKRTVESYAFTGPENVTEQGVAVPLIYGRVMCGSVVVSAGLSVSDVAIAADET